MKKIVPILSLLLVALLASCMTIEPITSSDGTSAEIERTITIEDLSSQTSESSEEMKALLDEVYIEEASSQTTISTEIVPEEEESSAVTFVDEIIDDTNDEETITIVTSPETDFIEEDIVFDTPVIEGVSIFTDGIVTAENNWMPAQEVTSEITPMEFVFAEELPLEIEGRRIETASTITTEEPKIIWEDEIYEPAVTTITSSPVNTSTELDILAEYEKFLADLGDDYTVAASEDIEDVDLETLLNMQTEEPAVEKTPEVTEEEHEEHWEKIHAETPEESKEKSAVAKFFSDLWADIKSLFVNLWNTIKSWFSKKN